MGLKSTITLALSRARYAAVGAAIGAAIGGLFGRSTASTGGATGALIGAIIAEKRHSAGGWIEQLRSGDDSDDTEESTGGVVDQVKAKTDELAPAR